MDKNMSLDDLIKKDKANKKRQGGNAFGGRGGSKFGGNFRGGNRSGNFVPRDRRAAHGGIFKRNRPQMIQGGGQQGGARPLGRRGGNFGGPRIQRVSIMIKDL
jgi:hypothetical protein